MSHHIIDQQTWTPPRPRGRFSALFYATMLAVAACSFLLGLTQSVP